ncbi:MULTISPECIES: hypothetical protein [unclassified Ornithinimicrobium]|uniref:hypothetical protein n=1 Tax=unclassified Ornithinimicrobium TaxID=2615080 RepID=UPI0038548A7F
MCRPVNCNICTKTTWAGCGQHVDQVMSGVPRSNRCQGHSDAEKAAASSGSIFGRIFGR